MGPLTSLNHEWGCADLDLIPVDADVKAGKRMGRRAGGHGTVFVINTAVAGAHEELGVSHPTDRAAQVGASEGESDKFGVAVPAQPGAGLVGETVPRKGLGIHEGYGGHGSDLEIIHLTDGAPDLGVSLDDGGKDITQQRDGNGHRADGAEDKHEFFQKGPAGKKLR
jgi:hypothetical protein